MPILFSQHIQPEKLKAFIQSHLNQNYSKEYRFKFTLMTICWDGMGDFIHNWDFYKYYKNFFEQFSNIQLQSVISIDSETLPSLQRIYRKEFTEENIQIMNQDNYAELSHAGIFISVQNPYSFFEDVKSKFNQHSALVNVSTGLIKDHPFLSLAQNAQNALCQSIVEYVDANPSHLYIHGSQNLLTYEYAMGLDSNTAGIKIYSQLKNLSDQKYLDGEKKYDLLSSLEHSQFMEDKKTYFETHSLNCGYLQSELDAARFVLLCSGVNDTPYVDVFINPSTIKIDDAVLKDRLKKLNVTKIEMINKAGEVVGEQTLHSNQATKILRLIHFPGTTDNDKEILLSLSDCVAASGDSSFSELISVGKFPYLGLNYKDYQKEIIKQLKLLDNPPEELIQYFSKSFDVENIGFHEVINYAKTNKEKIKSQWLYYCDKLIERQDVTKTLNTIFESSIFYSILRLGNFEEIKMLMQLQPSWKSGNSNFIFSTVYSKNFQILPLFYDNNSHLFHQRLHEVHPGLNESALSLLLKMGQEKIALPLIKNHFKSFDEDILAFYALKSIDETSIKFLEYFSEAIPKNLYLILNKIFILAHSNFNLDDALHSKLKKATLIFKNKKKGDLFHTNSELNPENIMLVLQFTLEALKAHKANDLENFKQDPIYISVMNSSYTKIKTFFHEINNCLRLDNKKQFQK